MDDLISRQAAIEAIENHIFYDDYDSIDKIDLINAIKALPSTNRYGRWIITGFMEVKCSLCGATQHELADANYCPNCGADMRGE